MSKLLKRSSIIALAIALSSLGQAASLHGKNFADKATVKGSELVLNGIGTRIAFMVVKVYVAALYVDKKTNNAEEILKSAGE